MPVVSRILSTRGLSVNNRYAVVDKISDGVATLLVGKEETEMIIGLEKLSADLREGDWLEMDENGNFIASPDITRERRQIIRGKLDKLRKRNSS